MNKQDRELLLKDVCARLPYGVLCRVKFKDSDDDWKKGDMKLSGVFTNECYFTTETGSTYTDDFEPYLRPMSSMTKEEIKEYESFLFIIKRDPSNDIYHTCQMIEIEEINNLMDFIYSHHLDYLDLIEKGLALPAPDDMYNF